MKPKNPEIPRPDSILECKYFQDNPNDRKLYSRFIREIKQICYLVAFDSKLDEEDIALMLQARTDLSIYYKPKFEALQNCIPQDLLEIYLEFIQEVIDKIDKRLLQVDKKIINSVRRTLDERLGEIITQDSDH